MDVVALKINTPAKNDLSFHKTSSPWGSSPSPKAATACFLKFEAWKKRVHLILLFFFFLRFPLYKIQIFLHPSSFFLIKNLWRQTEEIPWTLAMSCWLSPQESGQNHTVPLITAAMMTWWWQQENALSSVFPLRQSKRKIPTRGHGNHSFFPKSVTFTSNPFVYFDWCFPDGMEIWVELGPDSQKVR